MGMRAIWAFATVPASKKIKKNLRPLGRGGVTRPNLGRIPRDTYVHICAPPYTYIHVRTRMYTYVHERTHMYSYVRARTHTYSYVRTYMHVHVRTCPLGFSPAWDPSHPRVGVIFIFLAGWLGELAGLDGNAGWPSLSGNAPTFRSINKIIALVILHSC